MALGKVGIVLPGGGFICAFQVGVLLALWEKGIVPKKVQGISCGALNGAKIVESGPQLLKETWLDIESHGPSAVFGKFDAAWNIAAGHNSIFSDKGLGKLVGQLDMKKILESAIEFEVTVRNESLNKIELFHSSQFSNDPEGRKIFQQLIKASASLPGFLPPESINGKIYSDGYFFQLDSFADFDTVFIINGDQPYCGGNIMNINWRKRMTDGCSFILDECIEEKIKAFIQRYDFKLFTESDSPWLVLKHIQEFFKSIVGLSPKRLVIISPVNAIPTLMLNYFQKGDISRSISEGFEITAKTLDKLTDI